MKKCLVLSFENAQIFTKIKKRKHSVSDFNGTKNEVRKPDDNPIIEGGDWVEVPYKTIWYKHLLNTMLVLIGERPVPSMRRTMTGELLSSKIDQRLVEACKNAYVKIHDGINDLDEKKKNDHYRIKEKKCLTKARTDSFSGKNHKVVVEGEIFDIKCAELSWENMRRELKDEYKDFCFMVEEEFGIKEMSRPMVEVLPLFYKSQNKRVVEFFSDKKSHFTNWIKGKSDWGHFGKKYGELNHWYSNLVTKSVADVSCHSGEIRIVLDDDLIEKLENGTGCASFLEGGVVEIVDVNEQDPSLDLSFEKVFVKETKMLSVDECKKIKEEKVLKDKNDKENKKLGVE
jgi:hypothetical protein